MICETNEEFLQGLLLLSVVDDLIFDECIDMMWRVRTKGISLDEIYGLEPLESIFAQEKLSGIQSSSGAASGTVNCPICHELVSGKRFAPHLERCMNGGKRGSKRNYDYLHDEPAPARPAAKVKPVETDQDPLRNSLIVRLKLKNGVPKANPKRIGATMEEFLSGTVGAAPIIAPVEAPTIAPVPMEY